MTKLDLHLASADERIAAFTNVHEMWGRHMELDKFLAWRKKSPQHARAKWYVGTLNGEVVTSLGCYPMTYLIDGKPHAGIAIGAVHTRPDHRGHGFAPALLSWVEAQEQAGGAQYSLLYSDIKPEYYGRMGYLICPNWQGYVPLSQCQEWPQPEGLETIDFDPTGTWELLDQLYTDFHGSSGFAVSRDEAYWRYTLGKRPNDLWLWLKKGNAYCGYCRLETAYEETRVTDYAISKDHSIPLAALWSAAGRQAAQLPGTTKFGGWLPDDDSLRGLFEFERKPAEISMVKPLGDADCPPELIASCHSLCEIDHI